MLNLALIIISIKFKVTNDVLTTCHCLKNNGSYIEIMKQNLYYQTCLGGSPEISTMCILFCIDMCFVKLLQWWKVLFDSLAELTQIVILLALAGQWYICPVTV